MLIDAVKLGYTGFAQPVTERPPVDAVFNRYETSSTRTIGSMVLDAFLAGSPTASVVDAQKFHDNWEAVIKNGEPAHGTSLNGIDPLKDNQRILDNSVTHSNIDDIDTLEPRLPAQQQQSKLLAVAIQFMKDHFYTSPLIK